MKDSPSEIRSDTRTFEVLPVRAGPRPSTTSTNPHMQLNQQPEVSLSNKLLEIVRQWPGIVFAPSRRAPINTVGIYLVADHAKGPPEAFMLATEFAHVHPAPDFSLHLTLPEPVRSEAIAAGWAEPHPLAGEPTVSKLIVMLFAPRDANELTVITRLVEASWAYAKEGSVKANMSSQSARDKQAAPSYVQHLSTVQP